MKPLEPGCLALLVPKSAGWGLSPDATTVTVVCRLNRPPHTCCAASRLWVIDHPKDGRQGACECALTRIDPDSEIRAESHDEVTA